MRIGLLIYGDMDTVSGGYLYNRKLVDYLQRQGDQVKIISLPHGPYWRHLGDNFSQRVLKKIAGADIDILIQDELMHPSLAWLNRQLRKRAFFPVITLVHLLAAFDQHPFYSRWLHNMVEGSYLQSVDGLIANSRTTLAQVKQLLAGKRIPPHCIAVPAGDNFNDVAVAPEILKQHITAPGPLKILVAGNVIRRKGLHVLIQALQLLPPGDYHVSVAGRTDMEPVYVSVIEKMIRDLQLQGTVTLMGSVSGSVLTQLYPEHHLMVLPSAFEGYGIVYVEAQQFGLPVIGTTGGAASEIIRHGDNGYLINPGDNRRLAAHLKRLHEDRGLLATMSSKALTAYARHPTWDNSCDIIRQFLVEHINDK